MHDLREALRGLRMTPVISLVAILSLALGVGANTAIFSLVDTLLLRSLPVREPQRLAFLEGGAWTNPVWEQIRDQHAGLFDGVVAWSGSQFDLAAGGEAQFVEGLWASGRFFDVLGVPAVLGRTFTEADDRRGGGPDGPVAVISHRFWQQRYGGAADAVGRTLTIGRVPFTIVGVTSPRFFGPEVGRNFDVIIPIGTEPLIRGMESGLDVRTMWWLDIMVRLGPEQSFADATTALRGVQPLVRDATMPDNLGPGGNAEYLSEPMTLVPATAGPSFLRNRYRQPLLAIMVVVALVLFVACANIANLMLARANGRRHEVSVRLALGASRERIARQFLAESLLLSIAGAALGLLFARWSSRLLVRQFASGNADLFLDLRLDWRVLAFTAGVAIATAVLFGVVPALRASRTEPNDALKEQGRTSSGRGRRSLGGPLVVLQVALSLVLVVAAGLFVRTFAALATRDLGFDPGALLVISIDAERANVDAASRAALFQRVADAVSSVPGVVQSAASAITPVSGWHWRNLLDFPEVASLSQQDRIVAMNAVTPGWFATYRTTLVAGRDFNAQDREGAPPVAIVNQAFVARYLNGTDPLGRMLRLAEGRRGPQPPLQIVGVVRDSVYRSVREELAPILYRPIAQAGEFPPFVSVGVRAASGSPLLLSKSLAAAIGDVNRDLSLTFTPLADRIDGSLAEERVVATLSGFFGALALLLAAIGLYGVTSYAVGQRRTEIGIRLALGAEPGSVMRLVLARAAVLIGSGLILGAAVSLWAGRFTAALLYGLEPRDPLTTVAAVLVLAAAGALAAWLPAHRAARIDPADVLRQG